MHKIIRFIDKSLNIFISIILIIALLFSLWSCIDIFWIYSRADAVPIFSNKVNETSVFDYINQNEDVCAILKIPETKIDYPVLQGTSNTEYINRDFKGDYSISGSIFIDFRNSNDFSDPYTLFYGHRMNGGAMFGDIAFFLDKDYFYDHKIGQLILPSGDRKIEFFACSKTDASNFTIFNVDESNRDIDKTIQEIKNTSIQYDSNVELNGKIIALSTCENTTTTGRIILFGILR